MSDNHSSAVAGVSGLHCIQPLKGTENFNIWRIQMEDILTNLDLYKYVTQEASAPNKTITTTETRRKDEAGKALADQEVTTINEYYTKRVKDDRKALSNIQLRVDGNVLMHIQACKLSANAWDLLESMFQVKGTVGLRDLQRKFFGHWMTDGEDIEETSNACVDGSNRSMTLRPVR